MSKHTPQPYTVTVACRPDKNDRATMAAIAAAADRPATPQNDEDRYLLALQIASEDIYTTVDDLASKARAAGRITDAERVNAGDPRWQVHFSMIAKAQVVDLLNILKACAERLDRIKQDEENER